MLGIIGAMDVETNAIKNKVQGQRHTLIAGIDFVSGEIDNQKVCVAMCSPGKVNAAICTQAMIDNFAVDEVINVGVGCSLSEDVVIKDVVIASSVCQHDADTTALGDPVGFIYGIDEVKIKTDDEISQKLYSSAVACGVKTHRGTIASGDIFIADTQLKEKIVTDFNAVCGEMEGGAIGHTCRANNIPFAVIRCISDGGNEESQLDYPTFKKIAADISTAIIFDFIKNK